MQHKVNIRRRITDIIRTRKTYSNFKWPIMIIKSTISKIKNWRWVMKRKIYSILGKRRSGHHSKSLWIRKEEKKSHNRIYSFTCNRNHNSCGSFSLILRKIRFITSNSIQKVYTSYNIIKSWFTFWHINWKINFRKFWKVFKIKNIILQRIIKQRFIKKKGRKIRIFVKFNHG